MVFHAKDHFLKSQIFFYGASRQSVLQYSSCHKMALSGGSDLIFSGKNSLPYALTRQKHRKLRSKMRVQLAIKSVTFFLGHPVSEKRKL